jgi:membrane protein implicated in regulation of membrane protease activity
VPIWPNVHEFRGDPATRRPSDGLKLVDNALRWAAEPALKNEAFGSFKDYPVPPVTFKQKIDWEAHKFWPPVEKQAAGLIGVGGGLCLIAVVILAFVKIGVVAGAVSLGALAVLAPLSFYLGFKRFPQSAMGRRLVLNDRQASESGFASYTPKLYGELVGAEGVSFTTLRPSGMVKISGRKYSAVTSGEYIEKDTPVRVVAVQGSRIVVREKGKQS